MAERLAEARRPVKPRVKTKPSKAAKRVRVEEKRRRGDVKRARRSLDGD
jgi:ribosome-associated protein